MDKMLFKKSEWKSIDEYFEEQIFHAQLQLSPYTATGKYLRQICDNFQVKYKANEPDSVVRERFFREYRKVKDNDRDRRQKIR